MITRVEALNFRCLRYVHRPMNPFHVLVGPNASGKTTFLDVIGLLGDIVSGGLDYALSERTPNPQDLLFGRRGSRLELAVEATVPNALRQPEAQQWNTVRYQCMKVCAPAASLARPALSAAVRARAFPPPSRGRRTFPQQRIGPCARIRSASPPVATARRAIAACNVARYSAA